MWGLQNGLGYFIGGYSSLPSLAIDGDTATIPNLSANGLVDMVYVSGQWRVKPGSVVFSLMDVASISAPAAGAYIFPIAGFSDLAKLGDVWEIIAGARGTAGTANILAAVTLGTNPLNYDTAIPVNSFIRTVYRAFRIRSLTSIDLLSADYSQNSLMYDLAVPSFDVGIRLRTVSSDIVASIPSVVIRRLA